MFIEYNYELLDSDSEFITAVGAKRCSDEVHGRCEVCGLPMEHSDTFKLKNGEHICQEIECLMEYYGAEYTDEDEDDYDEVLERMREYDRERL